MQNMIRNMTIAVLATGLAACEAQNAEDTNVMTGGADTMAQAGMDSLAQQQKGMGERMEFEFQPVNNSEASGEVYATPAEGRTTIILTINAADTAQGQRHMAHIHAGTCENIGQVVAPLEAVTTVSGEGTSTTLLGQDFETFADGNHVVAAHEAGGEPGRTILCAPIPAEGTGGASDTAGSDTTQTSI